MSPDKSDSIFERIREILTDLYGKKDGEERFAFLRAEADKFLHNRSDRLVRDAERFNRSRPFESLKGRIFAIAYPDNVYTDDEYPLETLNRCLAEFFPSIGGVHILPERTMSHADIWPQDLFAVCAVDTAKKIHRSLSEKGILDKNRLIVPDYEGKLESYIENDLKEIAGSRFAEVEKELRKIIDSAWNSHFNDGGFSQKTRSRVDPRFGLNSHLETITEKYATMLDYVVNHLDVDNAALEEFRKGNSDGSAFIIIYRDRYRQLLGDRSLEATFRPRPFPLFTGMRKYPLTELDGDCPTPDSCVAEMNRIFTANGLEPLDPRMIRFMTIYFKIENDQGLTAEDKRIFKAFDDFLEERGLDASGLWMNSSVQARQRIFNISTVPNMEAFMDKLGFDVAYADLFMNDADHVFGREFYIYTTFSESQADVNPLSSEGFRMIIEDLFHMLSSGSLAMMRMDAIKYLWKEIGGKNFDMEEGNKLIEVIRLLMRAVSASTLPLDEINSPDPVVYGMAEEGGFAYLFGQVNAVPAAFNEGTLEPLIRFNRTKKEKSPAGFVPFVMLSTHDGRSVQGLGVQREDGHVSVSQFYNLMDTVESRGGKPKFRSVKPGEIPGDTFRKIIRESGFSDSLDKLEDLFDPRILRGDDICRLKDPVLDESDLLEELAGRLDADVRDLAGSAPLDYFIQWVVYGRTAYELCCTSRSAFGQTDCWGNSLSEEEEAQRLALAQLFVLTQGQDVPAVYFNDLLGLENDRRGYETSGRPRDLNRRKIRFDDMKDLLEKDPFTVSYSTRLNALLRLRSEDRAFYPGSPDYQFEAISDGVFMNHPWHKGNHSVILGNIKNSDALVSLDASLPDGLEAAVLVDSLTGQSFEAEEGVFSIPLEPYGYRWLKQE